MERSSEFVNGTTNQSSGRAQRAEALSLASFFASLFVSAAVLGVAFTLFISLKDYYLSV
jgi:hypothetical protein